MRQSNLMGSGCPPQLATNLVGNVSNTQTATGFILADQLVLPL